MARDNAIAEIIGHAGDAFAKLPNYGDVMEQRAGIQARQQALAEHNAAYAQAQQDREKANATDARRVSLGQMAAGGDATGARQGALAAGDLDMVAKLDSLGDAERKRVFEVSQHTAPLVLSLRQVPAEATAGAMQQIAPQLQAAGWTPQHIADVAQQLSDPGGRDAAFAAIENSAMTIADYQNKQKQDYTAQNDEANRGQRREAAYVGAGYLPPDGEQPMGGGDPVSSGPADIARMTAITAQSESGNRERGANGNLVTSPAGAQGRMQVMPGTNRSPGFGVAPAQDGSDAERTRVGQDYLKAMVTRYGDPAKAWAAYNAGPGRVDQAVKIAGANWMSVLPAETRAYVKRNVSQLGGESPQAGRAPGGLRPIPGGKADPNRTKPPSTRAEYRPLTIEEKRERGLPESSAFQINTDGQVTAVGGQSAKIKAPPSKALTDFGENVASVRIAREALQLLDPKNNSAAAKTARAAIGPTTGMMGERFSQFNDPNGVAFRALIGRIGGILIKDTSGAAVSASEDARLKKWVPVPTDTPAAATAKLRNLINAIGEYQKGFEDIYNEDNGYRPIKVRGGSGATPAKGSTPTRINSAADYANLPKGASYIAPGETKPRTKQ